MAATTGANDVSSSVPLGMRTGNDAPTSAMPIQNNRPTGTQSGD